jgi:predicted RNA methylase
MSLRGSSRVASDVFYTPRHATQSLLSYADRIGLLRRGVECWEPAAGAGHIAQVLHQAGHRVLASDVAPAEQQVHPVVLADFLDSGGPSGNRLNIITNPPYGAQSRLALAFLAHALRLMQQRHGAVALLLPFEFDAPQKRNDLVGQHPWFVGKVTVAKRIRWVNIPQSENAPMGCHAWYCYSTDRAVQLRAKSQPMMVAL